MSPNTSIVSKDWSRESRKTKKLLTLDQHQIRLTEYFPLQESVDVLFKDSSFSHLFISKIPEKAKFSTSLFQELVANAEENLKRNPTQRRYNEIIKSSVHLFYSWLVHLLMNFPQNMPLALPSLQLLDEKFVCHLLGLQKDAFNLTSCLII